MMGGLTPMGLLRRHLSEVMSQLPGEKSGQARRKEQAQAKMEQKELGLLPATLPTPSPQPLLSVTIPTGKPCWLLLVLATTGDGRLSAGGLHHVSGQLRSPCPQSSRLPKAEPRGS